MNCISLSAINGLDDAEVITAVFVICWLLNCEITNNPVYMAATLVQPTYASTSK